MRKWTLGIMALMLGCGSAGCIEETGNLVALAGYLAMLQELLAGLTGA